jgi:pSer/pThr/pTyr-binding forkhead associated (FHA) protein
VKPAQTDFTNDFRESPGKSLALVIIDAEYARVHRLPSAGIYAIGRGSSSDIVIQNPTVSRKHATVRVDGMSLELVDQGSRHGTRVEGGPLESGDRHRLLPGDTFEIGRVAVIVRAIDAEYSDTPTSPMAHVEELVTSVARGMISVLILGETGVGKERIASQVHMSSPRASKPFIKINCGALSSSLLESELFGYEKGAFTGATESRKGLVEAADGGSLFLDEIGEMSTTLQTKLLRVVEERRVRRVGGIDPIQVDVRFIAATHRDLLGQLDTEQFRDDP